jgi:hypothetical protein
MKAKASCRGCEEAKGEKGEGTCGSPGGSREERGKGSSGIALDYTGISRKVKAESRNHSSAANKRDRNQIIAEPMRWMESKVLWRAFFDFFDFF